MRLYVTHLRLGGGKSASSALSPLGLVSMFSKAAVSVVGSVVSTTDPHNTNSRLHSRNSIVTYLWPVLPSSIVNTQLDCVSLGSCLTLTAHLSH